MCKEYFKIWSSGSRKFLFAYFNALELFSTVLKLGFPTGMWHLTMSILKINKQKTGKGRICFVLFFYKENNILGLVTRTVKMNQNLNAQITDNSKYEVILQAFDVLNCCPSKTLCAHTSQRTMTFFFCLFSHIELWHSYMDSNGLNWFAVMLCTFSQCKVLSFLSLFPCTL